LAFAALAASLTCGLVAVTPASASVASLSGNWTNDDPNTRGITEILVSPAGGTKVHVRVFGECEPKDCDWGEANGATYSPGVSGNAVNDAVAVTTGYQQGFARRLVILREAGPDHLRFEVFSAFEDGSGRNSYIMSGSMHRVPHLIHFPILPLRPIHP
jgi:hypothetical protein